MLIGDDIPARRHQPVPRKVPPLLLPNWDQFEGVIDGAR
jgi:hypothetical protein